MTTPIELVQQLKAERRIILEREREERERREVAQKLNRKGEVMTALRQTLTERGYMWLLDFPISIVLDSTNTVYFMIPDHSAIFIQFHADGVPVICSKGIWCVGDHTDEFNNFEILSDALIDAERAAPSDADVPF